MGFSDICFVTLKIFYSFNEIFRLFCVLSSFPILHQSFLIYPIIELNNNYSIVHVGKGDYCEGVMWTLLNSASPSFPLVCFSLCF